MGLLKTGFKEKPQLTAVHRMEKWGRLFISSVPFCPAFSFIKIHPIGVNLSILPDCVTQQVATQNAVQERQLSVWPWRSCSQESNDSQAPHTIYDQNRHYLQRPYKLCVLSFYGMFFRHQIFLIPKLNSVSVIH